MHPKQFETVIALPGPERAEYAFKRFADREELWSLYDGGWALTELDDVNSALFPIWPEREFAAAYASGPWLEYEVRRIELHEFLVKFLPDFEERDMFVGVFPVLSVGSIPVTPGQFRDFLQQELDRF